MVPIATHAWFQTGKVASMNNHLSDSSFSHNYLYIFF